MRPGLRPPRPEPSYQDIEGLDNYLNVLGGFVKAFPDMRVTMDDMLAEGDRVVTRWTLHATHKGELMGIPPSGKQVSFSAISIHRVARGKVVEGWVVFDALGMLQQVGAAPAPA